MTFAYFSFTSLVKNVKHRSKCLTDIIKIIRDNSNKDRLNDILKLTGPLSEEEKSGLLDFNSSVLITGLFNSCKTPTHNTQCISPLAIKWLSKETGHYLSHILRLGAHVFLQHKKLIPYPATFNSVEMWSLPRQVDDIICWFCG